MTLIKYQNPNLSNYFDDDFFNFSPFNSMVKEFFGKDSGSGMVNVSENDKDYNLEFILPGYKKDDVKIEINDDILTVKADIKNKKEDSGKNYIRKEYVTSSFTRSFTLPDDVSDNMKAEMNDGILNIKVEKIKKEEKQKVKTISIN